MQKKCHFLSPKCNVTEVSLKSDSFSSIFAEKFTHRKNAFAQKRGQK